MATEIITLDETRRALATELQQGQARRNEASKAINFTLRAAHLEQVAAILEDEEATLKRFYRETNGMIRLQPANSEMEPLFTNRVQLRGVVRGVIRKFR